MLVHAIEFSISADRLRLYFVVYQEDERHLTDRAESRVERDVPESQQPIQLSNLTFGGLNLKPSGRGREFLTNLLHNAASNGACDMHVIYITIS